MSYHEYHIHYYRIYWKDNRYIDYDFTFVYSLDQSRVYEKFEKLNIDVTHIKILGYR